MGGIERAKGAGLRAGSSGGGNRGRQDAARARRWGGGAPGKARGRSLRGRRHVLPLRRSARRRAPRGDTVRCPLHHACFSLRTGQPLRAPALSPIARFEVERRGDRFFVLGQQRSPTLPGAPLTAVSSIVILGRGAAGQAAAEMLRREGYGGAITILSADDAAPCDRRTSRRITSQARRPRSGSRSARRHSSRRRRSTSCLGARATQHRRRWKACPRRRGKGVPIRRAPPRDGGGSGQADHSRGRSPARPFAPHIADSRAIVASLGNAKRAVVLGASFIGFEVAASLRARNVEVHVVAPEARPLERVLGPELGDWIRALHEEHGVVFHLGQTAKSIDARSVLLTSRESLAADLVVAGIGVRPAVALAQAAGLATDRGVLVSEYLETSTPGVFAAGDIARWPDPHSGEAIRVEHWVVAERQGQIAARNMIGRKEPCALVPFFWSQHYDVQTLVRRPRRDVGPHRREGEPGQSRLHARVHPRREAPRGGDDRARPREPEGGGRDGNRRGAAGGRFEGDVKRSFLS